jgi:tagatose 1,6-diphosphate aldolase
MRTIGKNRGLARLADADGHFRMVALDQRPPLFDAIAKAKGITRDQVEYSDVTAAKRLLVENLAPHCSSMLFDPNFAVPAAIDLLPPRCGLIMTLEEHRVEETAGGRKSRAITNWSVEKIRAMGGDAVKVLAWYRPDADAAVNEHQKKFVREIGEDCARHDIPYVLELLVYPFLGSANHTADYVESPGKLPGLVIDSVREFANQNMASISSSWRARSRPTVCRPVTAAGQPRPRRRSSMQSAISAASATFLGCCCRAALRRRNSNACSTTLMLQGRAASWRAARSGSTPF